MKIDLKQLKHQPGQTELYKFSEFWPDALVKGLGAGFMEPVTVDIEVAFNGQMYVARGRVTTKLQVFCSRCLEPSMVEVDNVLDLNMIDAENRKTDELKDDALLVEQDEVDIEPAVVEAIFAIIPLNPLCKLDCLGLCPVCGVNRNQQDCRCREDNIDPRWEALKKLT